MAGSGEGCSESIEGFSHITILATPLVFISLGPCIQVIQPEKGGAVVATVLGLSALFGIYQWLNDSHPLLPFLRE